MATFQFLTVFSLAAFIFCCYTQFFILITKQFSFVFTLAGRLPSWLALAAAGGRLISGLTCYKKCVALMANRTEHRAWAEQSGAQKWWQHETWKSSSIKLTLNRSGRVWTRMATISSHTLTSWVDVDGDADTDAEWAWEMARRMGAAGAAGTTALPTV